MTETIKEKEKEKELNYKQMYEDLAKKHDSLLKRYNDAIKAISNNGLDLQVYAKNMEVFIARS